MVLWNSQKLSNLKVHVLNLLLLDLFNHPWKKVTNQLREQLKLYEINQIKTTAMYSNSSVGAHMYRWTLWTIQPSLVSSSKKNKGKDKEN